MNHKSSLFELFFALLRYNRFISLIDHVALILCLNQCLKLLLELFSVMNHLILVNLELHSMIFSSIIIFFKSISEFINQFPQSFSDPLSLSFWDLNFYFNFLYNLLDVSLHWPGFLSLKIGLVPAIRMTWTPRDLILPFASWEWKVSCSFRQTSFQVKHFNEKVLWVTVIQPVINFVSAIRIVIILWIYLALPLNHFWLNLFLLFRSCHLFTNFLG